MADAAGYFVSAYVPNLLNVFQQLREHQGPTVDDPSARIDLYPDPRGTRGGHQALLGTQRSTRRHHFPGSIIRSLTNAGHAGPITHHLAETLSKFLPSPEPSHAWHLLLGSGLWFLGLNSRPFDDPITSEIGLIPEESVGQSIRARRNVRNDDRCELGTSSPKSGIAIVESTEVNNLGRPIAPRTRV